MLWVLASSPINIKGYRGLFCCRSVATRTCPLYGQAYGRAHNVTQTHFLHAFEKSDGDIVNASIRPSDSLPVRHAISSLDGVQPNLLHHFSLWLGCVRATVFFYMFVLHVHSSSSICPSRYLTLNHMAVFNQIRYIAFSHGKVVREQHYFLEKKETADTAASYSYLSSIYNSSSEPLFWGASKGLPRRQTIASSVCTSRRSHVDKQLPILYVRRDDFLGRTAARPPFGSS